MPATLAVSVASSENQETLESLGLSGATLMQLWTVGINSVSDLTNHTTVSLRTQLIESGGGSAVVRKRIEKAVADVHSCLSNRHQVLKGATKAELPVTTGEKKSMRTLEHPDQIDMDSVPRSEKQKDILFHFYQDARRFGRNLSRDEQFELGRRVTEHRDMQARDTLVFHNLRLVISIARKYMGSIKSRSSSGSSLELADLVQEGTIGLMIAAEKYDYQLNFAFTTYATWWIRQMIGRAIMDSGFIRIPVYLRELLFKIRRAMNEIALREGRPPTLLEIATAVDRTTGVVKSALRASRMQLISFEEPLSGESGSGSQNDTDLTWYERIADETALRADHVIEAREELNAACERLNSLTEALYEIDFVSDRDKSIFVQFYGLDGSLKKQTLEYVGERFDITRERIRQIIKICWDALRFYNVDMDNNSVIEELARIQELEKLAQKRVSAD